MKPTPLSQEERLSVSLQHQNMTMSSEAHFIIFTEGSIRNVESKIPLYKPFLMHIINLRCPKHSRSSFVVLYCNDILSLC